MKTIHQIRKYEKEIDLLEKKIARLQNKCKHKNSQKIAKSDTGNWDSHDDSYWYDCSCNDCDKRWMEDQ